MTTPDVSLASWFAKRAARTPSRRALTFEDHTSTYAELWQRVERLAAGLRAGGVNAGDRVGFLGLNQPAFFETLLATSRLGAIFVPLNFRLTAAELAYIIGDAGVHTLIVDEPHRPVIDTARDDLNVAALRRRRRASRRLGALRGARRPPADRRRRWRSPRTMWRSSCTPRARPAAPRGRC